MVFRQWELGTLTPRLHWFIISTTQLQNFSDSGNGQEIDLRGNGKKKGEHVKVCRFGGENPMLGGSKLTSPNYECVTSLSNILFWFLHIVNLAEIKCKQLSPLQIKLVSSYGSSQLVFILKDGRLVGNGLQLSHHRSACMFFMVHEWLGKIMTTGNYCRLSLDYIEMLII